MLIIRHHFLRSYTFLLILLMCYLCIELLFSYEINVKAVKILHQLWPKLGTHGISFQQWLVPHLQHQQGKSLKGAIREILS